MIVRSCTDDGLSGTLGADAVDGIRLGERPGLKCAPDAIGEGTAEWLVAPRLDRLGRATHVQEAVLAWVWRHGGRVFTADAGEILADDPDTPCAPLCGRSSAS